MKDQLEALVLQMYRSNILYSEGVREFKKRFILTRTIDELKIDVRQLRDGARRPPRSARPAGMDKKMVR